MAAALVVSSDDADGGNVSDDRAGTVAIVGGGLGGLALALALQQRGIGCVVLEKDSHAEQRAQGYGLTLQQGAKAARALGILDACRAAGVVSGSEGAAEAAIVHKSFRSDGVPLGVHGGGVPRGGVGRAAHQQNLILPRQALRRILLERLAPGTVLWSTSLKTVEVIDGSVNEKYSSEKAPVRLRLHLDDRGRRGPGGVSVGPLRGEGSLMVSVLIGADGLRSGMRAFIDGLPKAAKEKNGSSFPVPTSSVAGLEYLGVVVVLGIAAAVMFDDVHRGVVHMPGRVDLMPPHLPPPSINEAVDGRNRVYCMPYSRRKGNQPNELDLDMWQLSFSEPDEAAARALAAEGPSGLLAAAVARCGAWQAPGVAELLRGTAPGLVTGYPVYDRQAPWAPPAPLLPSARPGWCYEATVGSPDEALPGAEERASLAAHVLSVTTLLGDAAHPMAPFKGQGANQALLDAVCLARALFDSNLGDYAASVQAARSSPRSSCAVGTALGAFETEMQRRSAPKVSGSREASRLLHSPAALTPTKKRVTRAAAAAAAVLYS